MSLANIFTGSTNDTSVVLVFKFSEVFLGHVLLYDKRCDTNLERYLLETKPNIMRWGGIYEAYWDVYFSLIRFKMTSNE